MRNSFRIQLGFLILNFALLIGLTPSVSGQIQQAWIARYNNGITNGNHQALKMVLDLSGNIYVCGFSKNANSNLDYAVLKYAPNGNLSWAARYDSTNVAEAKPTGVTLDAGENVSITGNAGTVRFDKSGNQIWDLPYDGLAIVSDNNSNIIVTGVGTNFNTVKLNSGGSNLWMQSYVDVGPTVGQAVAVDSNGNSFVTGSDTIQYWTYFSGRYYTSPVVALLTIKYSANGGQLWLEKGDIQPVNTPAAVQVDGIGLDGAGDLYVLSSWLPDYQQFMTYKYSSEGNLVWSAFPSYGIVPAKGLSLDQNGCPVIVGQDSYQYNGSFSFYYSTYKLNQAGSTVWTNHYPQPPFGSSGATSIAVDSANNSYVTGYSPGANTGNDIVTIAYDTNGKQLWLQRYDGPAHGDDEGNAIAVDANGNVYVAGYETVPGGGTEMVLIKYAPGPFLKKQANGSFLLQAEGSANEPFDIQATTNLETWSDLAQTNADATGLLQYLDTNAPSYPSRFYLAIPQ